MIGFPLLPHPLTVQVPRFVCSENPLFLPSKGRDFRMKLVRGKKRRRSKSFSGFGLFEISLKKKSGDKKTIQIVADSRTSGSSKSDAPFSDTSKSSAPTLSSSSSSDSSVTPKTSPEETKDVRTEPCSLHHKKQSIDKGPKRRENCLINGRHNSYEGMLLILINLVITVFYGRLCAVLFTCLFLYSICWLRSSQRLVSPAEKVVVERDYRKKVIMEGLLQRNNYQRSRRGQ